MQYVTFGKLNLLYIYPFCAPIFYVLRFLVLFFANRHNQMDHSIVSVFSSSSMLLCFYMFLGEAFNGILLVKSLKNSGSNKEKETDKRSESIDYLNLQKTVFVNQFVKKIDYKKQIIKIAPIMFCAIIECAANTFLHEIAKANPALTTLQNFQIIFTIIVALLILKIGWYKHQWLSSSIIVIGSLISFFLFKVSTYVESIMYLIIMIIILVFLSLQEVLEKLIYIYGVVPKKLLFYEGVTGLILCVLINCISSLIDSFNPKLLKFFERNSFYFFGRINQLIFMDGLNIFFLIMYIICNMLYTLFIKYANYHFTPMSRAVSDTISIFITNYIYQNSNGQLGFAENIFVFVGFGFILIGCLLYNEIVIIQIKEFSVDTKREIRKRSELDVKQMAVDHIDYEKGVLTETTGAEDTTGCIIED